MAVPFTLFKAITAIKLAERLAREHQTTAIAVFWVEAEDHDWDEVRSCTVLDEALEPRTIGLGPRNDSSTPVGRITLDSQIIPVIDELEQILPATEFRGELIADLRSAYAPRIGMADAFARWLERVLGPRGLVVFDASDPAAKPIASRVFERELMVPGETVKRAAAAGAGLTALGYHSQVQSTDGGVALFRIDPATGSDGATRRPIRRHDGQFAVDDRLFPAAALAREAVEQPTAFSPNVLLRPVVQDTIFPTVSYVAGPNELAYLGQLKGVYEHFGLPMPLMYPRASATLVDSAAVRFLQKYRRRDRNAAAQRRKRAERSSCRPHSSGNRGVVRGRVARARCEPRARGGNPPPARSDARGRREINARADAARPLDASQQDDPGGKATG